MVHTEPGAQVAMPRRTRAEQYLQSTRRRLATGYAALVGGLLLAIVAATYILVLSQETTQIHDQLLHKVGDMMSSPGLLRILHQPPELKDEEEAVRTFIISADGVMRDADAVVRAPPDGAAVVRVLHTGRPLFTSKAGPTSRLSIYTAPIVHSGRVVGVIQAVTAVSPYNVILRYLFLASVGVSAIALLLSIALGRLMAGWGLQPVRSAIGRQEEFAQNAAHELRAPLTVIRTAADLALRSGTLPDMQDALQVIVRQTQQLDGVVGDLRLVAQGQAAPLVIERVPLNLAALVRDIYAELRPLARDRSIHLVLDAPPALTVNGDPQRLRQVVLILLDNALTHGSPGSTVHLTLEERRRKAVLLVRDTGPGIDDLHLPFIFDRFYQASRNGTGDPGNSGLGLTISREIIEAHGGRIAVRSQIGKGTIFRVTLPGVLNAA